MQTAIQQMIDFINDINDNDSTNFNYYYDSIITKLNELLEVEKQQISAAPELRYKDGTPIRKYNSPKLEAIEMENKQTAIESDNYLTPVDWLMDRIKWIHEETYNYLIKERQYYTAKRMEIATSSQKEISDDEILKASKQFDSFTSRLFFQLGAKWYREQLKNI